jgi:hypothetical protein
MQRRVRFRKLLVRMFGEFDNRRVHYFLQDDTDDLKMIGESSRAWLKLYRWQGLRGIRDGVFLAQSNSVDAGRYQEWAGLDMERPLTARRKSRNSSPS